MSSAVRIIVFLIVSIFVFSLCSVANGTISFATTDGQNNVGVWIHSNSDTNPTVEYVYSQRTEKSTCYIQGYLEKGEEGYNKDYYFEYTLTEDERFDISSLASFDIATKNVYYASYSKTKMLFNRNKKSR